MPKASDMRLDNAQSMLFKGPFGFGKTLAAASFALEGPTHLSYWDKKKPIELLTYFTKKRFGVLAEQIMDNLSYDTYSADNAGDYLSWLLDRVQGCRFTTEINDSLTFMTSSAVNWSLTYEKDTRIRAKLDEILPGWDEYKVETSLISQCLDVSKKISARVIWTAHPLPTTRVEKEGASVRVTKTNSLVAYGSKVAGMIPGAFTEIYHFNQQSSWDSTSGSSAKRFIASMSSQGDEFAKTALLAGYCTELDYTDKLFYQVWKQAIDAAQAKLLDQPTEQTTGSSASLTVVNPFTANEKRW